MFKFEDPRDFEDLFEGLCPKITYEMNEELNKHVNDDEIEKVVFSVRASGFLGPVGNWNG